MSSLSSTAAGGRADLPSKPPSASPPPAPLSGSGSQVIGLRSVRPAPASSRLKRRVTYDHRPPPSVDEEDDYSEEAYETDTNDLSV